MLPNFIGLGAPKCGTTTLDHILRRHPEIFLSQKKETHFFGKVFNFNEIPYGSQILMYESEFFSLATKKHKAVGEFSTSYLTLPYLPKVLYELLGKDLKLIVCIRNPVDRTFSSYNHYYRSFWETKSFQDAIKDESHRLKNKQYNFCYKDISLYAKHVKNFLKFFPKEQIFFLVAEEDIFVKNVSIIKNLLEFLGVDSNIELVSKYIGAKINGEYFPKIRKHIIGNKISIHRRRGEIEEIMNPSKQFINELKNFTMNQSLPHSKRKKMFDEYFRDDVEELEELIGRDLSIWYKDFKD